MPIPLFGEDLPPAGHPLLWRRGDAPLPALAGFTPVALQSGTAALAAAIMLARLRRPDIEQPQVILPGYGCPDLVAAAQFAGVEPLLVDVGADDPGYDLDALQQALSARVVAVVAVNFLGIAERLTAIRERLAAGSSRAALIEDDAQWFPEPLLDVARGDLVCTSFGRGKPVSLLGGGLLWTDAAHAALVAQLPVAAAPQTDRTLHLKAAVINALLRPRLYGLINRNPLFSLGQTRFKPLLELRALDSQRRQLLAANTAAHLARSRECERQLAQIVAGIPSLIDLPAVAGGRSGRLLRYPLLCRDRVQRDRLWQALQAAGLGATAMYQQVLPEVEGVGAVKAVGLLPGARRFAERLLTLPVHAAVTGRHLQRMADLLRSEQ